MVAALQGLLGVKGIGLPSLSAALHFAHYDFRRRHMAHDLTQLPFWGRVVAFVL